MSKSRTNPANAAGNGAIHSGLPASPAISPNAVQAVASTQACGKVAGHIAKSAWLYRNGQIREALEVAGQGLALEPDNADLLNHSGVFAARLGDTQAAEAAYRRAIVVQPDCAETHYNLGNLLKTRQRPLEAEAAYRCAIELRPHYVEAFSNLGNLLLAQGRPDEAEAVYRRATEINPDHADTWSNFGNLLQAQRRPEQAEAAYRRAIALRPGYAEALSNLGVLLKSQKRPHEAEAAYRRAIAASPEYAEAWSNLGVLLLDEKRLAEAEGACRRAIAIRPTYADAWVNLGNLLQIARRSSDAEAAYRRAIAINPGSADAHWNLSLLLLKRGQFGAGWRGHEARYSPRRKNRKMSPPSVVPGASLPKQWQGEALSGRSLLIWPEQGLGDELQFVRYMPMLKALGLRHLTLVCKPPLQELFAANALADSVLGSDDWRPELAAEFDYWCYLLSLPLHFGTTLENLPATLPYLRPEPERVTRWAKRLPAARFRIGLVWKGSPTHRNDANRSLPSLATLAPLWSISGLEFISLQKGCGEDEAGAPPAMQPLLHLGGSMANLADSAAVVSQLDLVISVDTAVAHLAGALGKPCWLLLPEHGTDWRWLEQRSDSPWYPEVMRLFRQSADGDWDGVVAQVVAALGEWMTCGRTDGEDRGRR